jgi:cytochrome P450
MVSEIQAPERGREVPVFRSTPVLGALFEVRRDYLGTMLRASREVGHVVRFDAGPPGWRSTFYSVSAPSLVLDVLGQPEAFTKATQTYREVRLALGNGMLTSEGEAWHRQRRFLAPMFTPRRIASSYAGVMVEEVQRLVERWSDGAASESAIDVHAEMVGLTSRIIGRILFGADMSTAIPQIMKFRFINDALLRRGISPRVTPLWLPTPANRRLTGALAQLRQVVADIIADRRTRPTTGPENDMLGLLLSARDDENAKDRLSDAEVADQALIFLLAGHDTTASTLACLLVELAQSASWQQTVRQELRQVLDGRLPTAADIPQLVWTGRVMREAMRLYPAAHSIGRTARDDQLLDGYRIPAGSTLVVSPWTIHRSPEVWSDPDRFDPGRFDLPSGESPGGHRYAWFPFGAGPHACVGMQLALMEVPIVMAVILQRFRLTTSLGSIPLQAAISLHPAIPLPVRLHI